MTDDRLRRAGVQLARMHAAMDDFDSVLDRVSIDMDYLLENPLEKLRAYEPVDPIEGYPQVIEEAVEYLKNKVRKMDLQVGLIHGDYGPHNLFRINNEFAAIDFDICGYGPRAFDIGTFFQFLDSHEQEVIFIEGYNSVRQLSVDELKFAELTFLLIRNIWIISYWLSYVPLLSKQYFPGAIDKTLINIIDKTKRRLTDIRARDK